MNPFEWRAGAKLNIYFKQAQDVIINVWGGNSRTNLSIPLGNKYKVGSNIVVDVSAGAVVTVRPRENRFSPVKYEFSYAVTGKQYIWIEKYFLGPDGFTYLIVAISVASFMAFLILIAIICCIVKCIRSRGKIIDGVVSS